MNIGKKRTQCNAIRPTSRLQRMLKIQSSTQKADSAFADQLAGDVPVASPEASPFLGGFHTFSYLPRSLRFWLEFRAIRRPR